MCNCDWEADAANAPIKHFYFQGILRTRAMELNWTLLTISIKFYIVILSLLLTAEWSAICKIQTHTHAISYLAPRSRLWKFHQMQL